MTSVLAIDLGGTNMRAALYNGDPSTLNLIMQEAAPASLAAFGERLAALRAEAGSVEAIGFAVPGLVEGTTCRWIPNLPYLDGLDMQALFPDLRVGIGNGSPAGITRVNTPVSRSAGGIARLARMRSSPRNKAVPHLSRLYLPPLYTLR